ncbi:diguanylate cyclase [Rhodovulum sp. ES.010]|uniref:GGDEF domain-containing protein n=1 Tax=Rhodovulum sp. ES.010 TaxID=1882821 RepID=UPI0015880C79|nr:GGDEF domain-containing protein [Rhodovulum sp. ES.010]
MLARSTQGSLPVPVSAASALFVVSISQVLTWRVFPEGHWAFVENQVWPAAQGTWPVSGVAASVLLCALHLSLLGELHSRRAALILLAATLGGTILSFHLFFLEAMRNGRTSAMPLLCVAVSIAGQAIWFRNAPVLKAVLASGPAGFRMRSVLVLAVLLPLSIYVLYSRFGISRSDANVWLPLAFGVIACLMIAIAFWLGWIMHQLRLALDEVGKMDPLTGALSRRGLADMSASVPNQGVILFEIDGFEEFGEAHGPRMADELLKETARKISETLRGNDLLARCSGGRFFVFVDVPNIDTLFRTARRLQERLETVWPRTAATNFPEVSASFGVSMVDASEITIEGALQRAETALHQAEETLR